MKSITGTLLTAATLMLSSVACAKGNSDCPSIDTVLNHATFVRAYDIGHDDWIMKTNSFQVDNRNWNILFVLSLPDVHNGEEALNLGQLYFNQHATLNEPKLEGDGWRNICIYNENSRYIVAASNPPMNNPSLNAGFYKKN